MIIKPKVLLYTTSKFKELKQYFELQGRAIVSVSEILIDDNRINELFGFETVIDISSLWAINQYYSEKAISSCDDTFIFIGDIAHREYFENQLRFCFSEFTIFEDYIEVVDENSDKQNIIAKEHKKIIDLNKDELNVFFQSFNELLYGHEKFKADFKKHIDNFIVFNRLGEHKILSLFLMGDSGVGKTEVARAIHKALGGQSKMAKVNFGNYSSDNSLNSLIGSPRGYIGSEDGEIFIRVNQSDTGIILIDEFEKSNSTLFNYFLDVLENGKMSSSLTHEIDLNGFIIVFTSNISKEDFKKVISPELRSRFDYKGYFSILKTNDKIKYVQFRISSIVRKYNKNVQDILDNLFELSVYARINVGKFENMRDLNRAIKQVFVDELELKLSAIVSE